MHLLPFDTEGFLLQPGVQAPPIVCLQHTVDSNPAELIHARDPACKRMLEWGLQHAVWGAHNAAHDVVCLMASFPDHTDEIFAALNRDQFTCSIIRQKLRDIARGSFKHVSKSRGYALDAVGRIYGVSVNKEDPWRLRYGTLWGVPVSRWPADARRYALDDVVAERAVLWGQEGKRWLDGRDIFADQYRQTRASVWLRLMECRGIRTDPERVEEYIQEVHATLVEDRALCQAAGLVRADGTKDTKAAQSRMLEVCRETDEPDFPITETGEKQVREYLGISAKESLPVGATWRALKLGPVAVRLDEEACADAGDLELEAYQRYGTSSSQISRAERLRHGLIQSRFGTLQDTGRTSCSQGDTRKTKGGAGFPSAHGAQLQNPAKDKKVKRLCPPGWVDSGNEWRDLLTGQTIPKVVKRKGTRTCFIPRPGFVFGSTDYSGMELAGWGQICLWKVGFSRMVDVLRQGIDPHLVLAATLAKVSVEEAIARYEGKRGPELKAEMKGRYRQLAKIANFGFQGGMGYKKLRVQAKKVYGVVMSLEEARDLRKAWLATWPEAQKYFDWVSEQLSGPRQNQTGTFVQPWSERVRGGCWYSAGANTMFQGFCADIAKLAGWRVTQEMYTGKRWDTGAPSPLAGSRIVNFLHDEIFSEFPEHCAHEAALRQAEIMTQTARELGPALPWPCETAIMRRWYKDAEPVYQGGRLVCWEPEAAAA